MAESDGVLGDGTELWLTNGATPPVLTKVKGLTSVNRPNTRIGKENSTDLDSGKTEEFIPGMATVPELKFTYKYEPGSPTELLIEEHKNSRKTRPFKIVTPEEDGTTQDHTGVVFIMTNEPGDAAPGKVRTATATGQPGAITQAASA